MYLWCSMQAAHPDGMVFSRTSAFGLVTTLLFLMNIVQATNNSPLLPKHGETLAHRHSNPCRANSAYISGLSACFRCFDPKCRQRGSVMKSIKAHHL